MYVILQPMFSPLFTAAGLISLLTLSLLEIVLGIDNIIFISILTSKLPKEMQKNARNIGLILALVVRIILLFSISWIAGLRDPIVNTLGFALSGRDMILFAGGLFLLWKTTVEINHKLEGYDDNPTTTLKKVSYRNAITQIILIDIVFSFDSILTAVGLSNQFVIMVLAVVIAMSIMIAFSGAISDFINDRPTIKMLALSFLLVIAVLLIAEAFHYEVPKGYVYFAMAFSFTVEMLNLKMRKNNEKKVVLNQPYDEGEEQIKKDNE